MQGTMLKGRQRGRWSRAVQCSAARHTTAEQLAAPKPPHPSQAACACRCQHPRSPASGTPLPALQRPLRLAAAALPWGLSRSRRRGSRPPTWRQRGQAGGRAGGAGGGKAYNAAASKKLDTHAATETQGQAPPFDCRQSASPSPAPAARPNQTGGSRRRAAGGRAHLMVGCTGWLLHRRSRNASKCWVRTAGVRSNSSSTCPPPNWRGASSPSPPPPLLLTAAAAAAAAAAKLTWRLRRCAAAAAAAVSQLSPSSAAGASAAVPVWGIGTLPSSQAADGKWVREYAKTRSCCTPGAGRMHAPHVLLLRAFPWGCMARPESASALTAAPR